MSRHLSFKESGAPTLQWTPRPTYSSFSPVKGDGNTFDGPIHSGVTEWLKWAGLQFDPFGPLDAAADPRIGKYLVGHHIFARVWGDKISWLFAPAGGGKTALRIAIAQACWTGQETNHPFPLPYVPPFLLWGHVRPTQEEHLAALVRAGAAALFLAMAHRPHWLFRMGSQEQRRVATFFRQNLPGPLSAYLERFREAGSAALIESTDPALLLRDPPDTATLIRWCDVLEGHASDASPAPSPAERWVDLHEVLREILGFPSIYILADGLDGAPETTADPSTVANCLESLLLLAENWASNSVYLKAFLPIETYPTLSRRFPSLTLDAVSTLDWTPDLLAEVIRRRIYVASEGTFGSLDAVASPALRDVETQLAKAIRPLPREMLIITRRVVEEHVRREYSGLLTPTDVEAAIHWYQKPSPHIHQ